MSGMTTAEGRCQAIIYAGEKVRCGRQSGHAGSHMGTGRNAAVSVSWARAGLHMTAAESARAAVMSEAGPITDALVEQGLATDPDTFHWLTWRTGRTPGLHCTIYAQVGAVASDDDVLIGTMDTPRLASEAVESHNAVLMGVQRGCFRG